VIAEPVLDRRLDSQRIKSVPLTDVDRMSIRSPQEPMKSDELQAVPESAVIIEQAFENQPGMYNVGRIRALAGITPR
jgi:hypothetical protein